MLSYLVFNCIVCRLPADGLSIVMKKEDVKEGPLQETKKEEEWLSYTIYPVAELLNVDQVY